jgi:hypothetical protein
VCSSPMNGKVMTAAHVVHAMEQITVEFLGSEPVPAHRITGALSSIGSTLSRALTWSVGISCRLRRPRSVRALKNGSNVGSGRVGWDFLGAPYRATTIPSAPSGTGRSAPVSLSSVYFRRPKPLNHSTNGLQPLPHEKGHGLRRSARCCGRVSLWLIIHVHPETHRIASCHNRLLPCVTLTQHADRAAYSRRPASRVLTASPRRLDDGVFGSSGVPEH